MDRTEEAGRLAADVAGLIAQARDLLETDRLAIDRPPAADMADPGFRRFWAGQREENRSSLRKIGASLDAVAALGAADAFCGCLKLIASLGSPGNLEVLAPVTSAAVVARLRRQSQALAAGYASAIAAHEVVENLLHPGFEAELSAALARGLGRLSPAPEGGTPAGKMRFRFGR